MNASSSVLVMVTDLHHLFLGAIVRSYTLFPFGHAPPVGDFTQLAIRTMGQAFALGIQLAALLMQQRQDFDRTLYTVRQLRKPIFTSAVRATQMMRVESQTRAARRGVWHRR